MATPSTNEPVQLVCSEIWGGNRPIDRAVEAPGVRGRLFSRPCGGDRGGDVHYMSICGSGLLSRYCLADVAGHGESVASVSGELHRLLRRYMNNLDQRRLLHDLNQRLEAADDPVMTTAAMFTYYPPSGNLSYCYAGHPPAWHYSARDERWERLDLVPTDGTGANLPLAIAPHATFSMGRRRVEVGDRLLVVTDGVLEAPSPVDTQFGDSRLTDWLSNSREMDIAALGHRLIESLVDFTADPLLSHDDVSFLFLEFVTKPRGPALWHVLRNRLVRPRGNTARM